MTLQNLTVIMGYRYLQVKEAKKLLDIGVCGRLLQKISLKIKLITIVFLSQTTANNILHMPMTFGTDSLLGKWISKLNNHNLR